MSDELGKTSPDEQKPPELIKLVRRWLYSRFGLKGIVLLAILGGAFTVWWQWDAIVQRPFVRQALEWLSREAVPVADPNRFSVLVARFGDDTNQEYQKIVVEGLSEFSGIQVLPMDREIASAIENPEERMRLGHDEARDFLDQSSADVAIWGVVLKRGGESTPKLYWTTPGANQESIGLSLSFLMPGWEQPSFGRYLPTSDLGLPTIFWRDLLDVLAMMALTEQYQFVFRGDARRNDPEVAQQLEALMQKMQLLIDSTSSARLSHEAHAKMLVAYMNAFEAHRYYTKQRGLSLDLFNRLKEAATAYRAAIAEISRDQRPFEWADLNTQYASVLMRLGQYEMGMRIKSKSYQETIKSYQETIDQAIEAYKASLGIYTREDTLEKWVAAQAGVGFALLNRDLGTLPSTAGREARQEESIERLELALRNLTRESSPPLWGAINIVLGFQYGFKSFVKPGFECQALGHLASGLSLMVEMKFMKPSDAQGLAKLSVDQAKRKLGSLKYRQCVEGYRTELETIGMYKD
jgi:tetratricopeptide (TPR) repeat protein